MTQNYKMIISYDGTRYFGWESQTTTDMTIQGKLQNVLSLMVGEPVKIIGAGRTDAGVHARAMVANVNLNTEMPVEEIRDYMNQYLPDDICIEEVKIASDRFHSRYNAIGKTYCYTCYIGDAKPVFDRKYVYTPPEVPDAEQMRKAAEYLKGEHDFASFCAKAQKKKSTVRNVDKIDIVEEGGYLRLIYHGNGFLYNMVRILTGTLLEVGFGKRTPESMVELLEAKNRKLAGYTAPPQGLCLMKVDYD